MKTSRLLILIFTLTISSSCVRNAADIKRTPLLEVEGKFLYLDEVQVIIPPNVTEKDSTAIAESFIRKWITDVLLYENAKRNFTNKEEIDRLLEDYRKSLIIHQYQQKLIEQRLPKEPSEAEMLAFYEKYNEQLQLKENIIKGILLIVHAKAPQLTQVRSWMQSGNTKALENIEKYSIQNAISYDYFANKWTPLFEVLKKIPVQIENPSAFVSSNRLFETSDSTKHYFLRIESYHITGDTEPFELAKDKISKLILNKLKVEFISNFETEIYNDAIKSESVTFFNK
ncbi:MAG: peptidyl-prolyl cis-trans isomerase [Paludibacter sp.]|nr:peptidyl-prolyl cis-trans isomerase [Paludibacter sp.]